MGNTLNAFRNQELFNWLDANHSAMNLIGMTRKEAAKVITKEIGFPVTEGNLEGYENGKGITRYTSRNTTRNPTPSQIEALKIKIADLQANYDLLTEDVLRHTDRIARLETKIRDLTADKVKVVVGKPNPDPKGVPYGGSAY